MQAHEELKKSEDRLRTIIDTIPTSVFCSLADGADQFWNQRWRDYAGVSSDDARYRGWEAVIHPEDAGKVAEAWDRSIASGRAGEIEVRLRRFDGEYRWFLCRWEPLRDEAGQIVSWYGANADIDDAKRAEQNLAKIRSDLEHVTRITSLSALTASIAHEVNQPLSGIMTNAGACLKMLDADPPNIAGARDTARRTLRDGARAADVISRLRALFSNEGTAVDPVDLNEAAREVVMLSRTELQSKRVILQMELAEDLPLVSGDRIQLQQVILNLLANASEAMSGVEDRPRRLVIRTGQEQNQVSLSVQDVGAGFNVKDADRLFNAFYTTKSGGMGIGLHISRSIIERHQGRLLARSNDGPGATFALYLPRLGPPATGEVRSQAETC
jgi:PAS domain S-box-containing protein